jgi:hypothetical protein
MWRQVRRWHRPIDNRCRSVARDMKPFAGADHGPRDFAPWRNGRGERAQDRCVQAMKSSLSFITKTATVSESTALEQAGERGARTLQVLGYHAVERTICLLEHDHGVTPHVPRLYAIRVHGLFAGRMSQVSGWPDGALSEHEHEVAEHLRLLQPNLAPLFPVESRYFHMSTRVIKRHAVEVEPNTIPVRKYDVRVTVRPAPSDKVIPMGARKSVTAYLRPRVRMEQMWVSARLEFALAQVSYIGVPYEIGFDRQTAIFLPLPTGISQLG